MTAKEYLGQAYRIDARINSKLEQIASLQALATKATSTLHHDIVQSSSMSRSMAGTIDKMIDLQTEINNDIDNLVDTKREIASVIKSIQNPEHQTILELRYLCFKSWEQIAEALGYSTQHVFRFHTRALDCVKVPKVESKCD